MYRVLIVDDEPIIRNGISAFIDWEKEGASVEECANGAEALARLESRGCDILITDIKMPVMDGIELMRRALALCPWIKVILISNYSDFNYVKEGLKLGAVDYLLKLTLQRDDLLAVLHRSISMLEEERRKVVELKSYQQSALYLERKRAEQEIKRLIVQEQPLSPSTIWVPSWLDHSYACVYLMLDSAEEWKENHGYLYVQLLLEELQEAFYEHWEEGSALLAAESSLFLIFPDPEREAGNWLLQWKERVEAEWGISTSVGFAVKRGARRILPGYFGSRSACQRRFFEGIGGLYTAREAENHVAAADPLNDYDWEPFFEMIRGGEPASFAVDLAMERWKSMNLSPEQVQQEAISLLTEACRLHADTGALLPERYEQLRKTETLEQLAAFMSGELEAIGKSFIPKLLDNGYGGQLITKALEYIASHYTENLTLQSVADTVHLSKSYFSLLFKKQTERTFIDYLIELRIREAKRLLTQLDSRISDVAKAAGFKDVKYFSKVFKKSTGLTPMEYRESTRCQLFLAE
ncbi:two-component system response regulator YesN [Paenibacillus forsythiae]|uniref:Two-component system response regulator YesN n=1 Tax=Paenibacillus forsythiae TaxID=365616 RepID=A0ABU3HD21_9BACL|nr:response regulator [Paenibacillus forsythiae]MDT3428706.1 two-component system response regulator YesN [Paenibacillus forsythiae]